MVNCPVAFAASRSYPSEKYLSLALDGSADTAAAVTEASFNISSVPVAGVISTPLSSDVS